MGWSVFARSTSMGRSLVLVLLMALSPASICGAQDVTVAANGAKAPGSDATAGNSGSGNASADTAGSDDGDSGANDDPVWGYFLGKTAYVFFHEIAAGLRNQDGVVIAATPVKRAQLATLLLVAESGKRFGGAVLGDAVSGWILSWRQDAQEDSTAGANPAGDGWDSKNLSVPQVSDLLCALYGSDPTHFHGLVDNGDIKADAAAGCVEDYRKLATQWGDTLSRSGVKLVLPASDKAVGAAQNGAPTEQTGNAGDAVRGLSLEQQPSTAPALADFTGWLSDLGLIGNLVAETNRDLSLAKPIKLVMLQCDKDAAAANAAADGQMLLCYEWLKSGYDAATAQNIEAPPE